jgi:hypothetical protein
MDFKTLIMIMALGVLVMAWYGNTSKRNQILCTFNRVNKTQIIKFVKMQSRYVVFDNAKYDIVPDRIVFRWFNIGFVHMLFPQWVASLNFSHTSRWPLDPNHQTYNAESPEVRKSLNKEEWIRSFVKGAVPQSKSANKLGGLAQWLPWVAIVLVIVVAVYFNSKMSSFGNALDAMVGQINSISK